MQISSSELISVLTQFNPWWRQERISDLPGWHRAAFSEIFESIYHPRVHRAILLSGARQIGKTTLLQQVITKLLEEGVPAANIIYVTFDHPIIKMAGINDVLTAWREREPQVEGPEYLFLDEAQCVPNWGTWVKHQVDFFKNRRIMYTGSAMQRIEKDPESAVGRTYTIRLNTLSFFEYLKLKLFEQEGMLKSAFSFMKKQELDFKLPDILLKNIKENQEYNFMEMNFEVLNKEKYKMSRFFEKIIPKALPKIESLESLFDLSQNEIYKITELAAPYLGHFHEYLTRGGFPQTVKVKGVTEAQRLLREDIIDKVLKRDMTALFGVRRVVELENTFLYLCMHDGGLLNMETLSSSLGVSKPTAQNYIGLLEDTYLIYRLPPFGYGKEILKAKYKIYLADPAISPAVFLRGKNILDDPTALGVATETAVFKHLYAHYRTNARFSYWHGAKKHEVDLVVEDESGIVPFEIKYRSQHTGSRDLKGLIELCNKKAVEQAFVITKSLDDFGAFKDTSLPNTRVMRIPAALLCYWIGELEYNR